MNCLDCRRDYPDAMAMSLLIPKDQWLLIHPEDGGLICANCMIRRAEKLDGAINITGRITFADEYAGDGPTPYDHATQIAAVTRERDEARAEVARLRAALTEAEAVRDEQVLLRENAESAADDAETARDVAMALIEEHPNAPTCMPTNFRASEAHLRKRLDAAVRERDAARADLADRNIQFATAWAEVARLKAVLYPVEEAMRAHRAAVAKAASAKESHRCHLGPDHPGPKGSCAICADMDGP